METRRAATGIRIWPGWLIVTCQWLAVFGLGQVMPGSIAHGLGIMVGSPLGFLLLLLYWGFWSRASRTDKIIGLALPPAVLAVTAAVSHNSVVPMVLVVYGIPVVSLAFVLTLTLIRSWPESKQRLAWIAALLVAGGGWALVRSDGVDGDMQATFAWRWQATAEEELLESAEATAPRLVGEAGPVIVEVAWPGFRGAERNGVISSLEIATDWQATPPVELWRRPVGPGWGSFAVAGGLIFTQEQRGDVEIVSAYRAATGDPVWSHRDAVRFWEALAGAGPRATPELHAGRVYSFGATGLLNALDAATGELIWSRDVAADTGAPTPEWGFASSPLVVDGLAVVYTGAQEGKTVAAYDTESGEPRWYAAAGSNGYSSVHLATLQGVRQLLVLTGEGLTSHAPADGATLWRHDWPVPGARCIQPAFAADGDPLVGTGFGIGVRRLDLSREGDSWTVEEQWTSTRLKPYYNDFVVHRGHAYGFDGRILAAVDLESGERRWKGGRYGHGQLLLLEKQDLLLVVSDRGDVALVAADPSGFTELARITALKGKTWNHPVIADGVLYVRNGEEMAAFRLPVSSRVASLP